MMGAFLKGNMREERLRIVVIGAGGRLGAAVEVELASAGHHVTRLDQPEFDITNPEQVPALLSLGPDVIVNCAAYNAVDDAETGRAAAFAVNAHGPALLAAAAEACGALLVHYSTDFVFDGLAHEPYCEEDATRPLGVYGASKLAGEVEARRTRRHYVLRLASLFGGTGLPGHRATIDLIADHVAAGFPVRAMVDRTVSPSYVADVARVTRSLVEREVPYGVYHCVNTGFATWYQVAQEIARRMRRDATILPARAADFSTPGPRPRFCALSNRKLMGQGIWLPTWQSAIARHLAKRPIQVPAATATS
jgi:dTDP-4-dehydrorhamnose reductase